MNGGSIPVCTERKATKVLPVCSNDDTSGQVVEILHVFEFSHSLFQVLMCKIVSGDNPLYLKITHCKKESKYSQDNNLKDVHNNYMIPRHFK